MQTPALLYETTLQASPLCLPILRVQTLPFTTFPASCSGNAISASNFVHTNDRTIKPNHPWTARNIVKDLTANYAISFNSCPVHCFTLVSSFDCGPTDSTAMYILLA